MITLAVPLIRVFHAGFMSIGTAVPPRRAAWDKMRDRTVSMTFVLGLIFLARSLG